MEYKCKVTVVDAMMGAGKSSAAINYINSSQDSDESFLIITPYLPEVERYRKECPTKGFKAPSYEEGRGSKLESLKKQISRGENIVSTHALFQKFDDELMDLCRIKNYTLIMDEVTDVIEKYEITSSDLEVLKENFVTVDENTGIIHWREDRADYKGKFSEVKRLCEIESLACYGDSILMWLFPVQAFNCFGRVFILTYMFKAQLQRHYYDYYNLEYSFMGVDYIDGKYQFTYNLIHFKNRANYNELIHIIDSPKMNRIGDRTTDLSLAWFKRNKGTVVMTELKRNITNFFRNIRTDNSKDNIWSTFKDYRTAVKGKGYSRGYIPLNCRATNDYQDRTSVAYLANRYMNPVIKNFFEQHGVEVDEDGYALSEMLQFIWRSAIRCGNEIWVYIPSSRMRELLADWIEENSK